MNLKELQAMIKEEFDSYMGEADDLDVSVSDNDVDVDAEMGGDDATGEEDVLRSIYDLLAVHFGEGEVEDEMGDDMGDDIDDVEGAEAPDSELDELSNHGVGTSAKNSSGPNAGYTNAKGVKEGIALQERFLKLANIIK